MSLSLQDLELSRVPFPQDVDSAETLDDQPATQGAPRVSQAWVPVAVFTRGLVEANSRAKSGKPEYQMSLIQSVLSIGDKLHMCTQVSVCTYVCTVVVLFCGLRLGDTVTRESLSLGMFTAIQALPTTCRFRRKMLSSYSEMVKHK